ncbi:MAG: hypothetical protein AAF413_03760 [Patescibacteria group bacterium]
MLMFVSLLGIVLSFLLGVVGLHVLLNSNYIMESYKKTYKKGVGLFARLREPSETVRKAHVIMSPLLIAGSLGAILNIAYYWPS